MGIYEGLAQIRKHKEDQDARKAAAEAGKINWLNIEDGETVKVWFLQELDRSALNYHEELGLGIMATEHSNPDDYRRKALCSMEDEEQCLGCEKHKADWKAGWKPKARLYINVLVERKNGDREVAVMSQANGSKSVVAPLLLEYAVDEETVADRWWKLTRNGKGSETSYLPRPQAPSKDVDVMDYADKVQDVRRAVREVAYDDQFEHYFGSRDNATPAEEGANSGGWPSSGQASSTDDAW